MAENDKQETMGLTEPQKRLLLDLSVWKIRQLLKVPFRFRSGCHLRCKSVAWADDTDDTILPEDRTGDPTNLKVDIVDTIRKCGLGESKPTRAYYPSSELFEVKGDEKDSDAAQPDGEEGNTEE